MESKDLTVYEVFMHVCNNNEDSEFLIFKDQRYTYGQFRARTKAVIHQLKRLEIKKGDKIALFTSNRPEFLCVYFAVAFLGAILIPINIFLENDSIKEIIDDTLVSTLIFTDEVNNKKYSNFFNNMKEELDHLKYVIDIDLYFSPLNNMGTMCQEEMAYMQGIKDTDNFVMIYTSGSTGKAKGVLLSHRNIITNARAVGKRLEYKKEDVFLFAAPLFSIFGVGGIMMALLPNAKIVLMESYTERKALELIQEEKISIHSGNWTMFTRELNDPKFNSYNLKSLRLGIIGGAVISPKLIEEVKVKMGMVLCNCYGMTEAAGGIALVSPHADKEEWLETVGAPLEGIEIRIMDQDKNEVSCGISGDIICRGDFFSTAYYNKDGIQATHNEEGWFNTEEVGHFDLNGYLRILGRKKDIVFKGERTVSLSEIEQRINELNEVADCAVLALDHKGEEKKIYAFVLEKRDAKKTNVTFLEDKIFKWCLMKLPTYKVPDKVQILSEFPLTGTGKVDKISLAKSISIDTYAL